MRKGGLVSGRTTRRRVLRITLRDGTQASSAGFQADLLASEEPLGIRVDGAALSMTMRTPGDDLELAAGFPVSENVVRSPADIASMTVCYGTTCGHVDHDGLGNIVDVVLAPGVTIPDGARRSFLTTSACGV